MDWLDYREKLKIGFNDEGKFKYFITRLFIQLNNILPSHITARINVVEYSTFCIVTGTPMMLSNKHGYYDAILEILDDHTHNFQDFISYYIAFLNSLNVDIKSKFKTLICTELTAAHIPYEIIEENENYFIFPKGAKELDDALISDSFIWLKDYPLTQKAWIKALKDYSEATDLTASETADNFRKALERFFQEFFESDKSIENLFSEYGTFLSNKGVPSGLSNNLKKLLDTYIKYNNDYAKHHDKASKNVLEYIMYQTGSLIRLMITLK